MAPQVLLPAGLDSDGHRVAVVGALEEVPNAGRLQPVGELEERARVGDDEHDDVKASSAVGVGLSGRVRDVDALRGVREVRPDDHVVVEQGDRLCD